MKLVKVLVILFVAGLIVIPGGSFAKDGDGKGRRPGAVLYKVKADATDSQIELLLSLLDLHGAKPAKVLKGLDVCLDISENLTISEELLCEAISATMAVEFAEPDYCITVAGIPNDPQYSQQWHHPRVNSPGAWDITSGRPDVVVAIVDTGVEATHPELVANMKLPGYNTVDNTTNSAPCPSANGWHGTSVAGLVAAAGNNGVGIAGMGWNVKILPVRVLYPDGSGYISDVAEGIRWAADQGAKVANVSMITAGSATIDSAAQYLRSKGGVAVLAAENNGIDAGFPDYASCIYVGATDESDAKTSWSNYGTYIDIVAPGINMRSTYTGGSYATCYGTSFSAPVVAGIAALIYSVNPSFTPAQVESFIFGSCTDLGAVGEDNVFGHGRVNAAAAVAAARDSANNIAPVALVSATPVSGQAPLAVSFSGSASYDPDGQVVTYAWDFGDGSTATGISVVHTYTVAGTFTARLTVTDNKGAASQASQAITVSPDPSKVLHVSSITMSAASTKQGTQAQAKVIIVNPSGTVKSGATVTGAWSGIVSGVASGVTGADGSVSLNSPKSRKSGTFTFTVTGVSVSGYSYNPGQNVVSSASVVK